MNRDEYRFARRKHRASGYAYARAVEYANYAESPQSGIERRRAESILTAAPRGYGRRVIDPLIVRRARRNDWIACKRDYATGSATIIDLMESFRRAGCGRVPMGIGFRMEALHRKGVRIPLAEAGFVDFRQGVQFRRNACDLFERVFRRVFSHESPGDDERSVAPSIRRAASMRF